MEVLLLGMHDWVVEDALNCGRRHLPFVKRVLRSERRYAVILVLSSISLAAPGGLRAQAVSEENARELARTTVQSHASANFLATYRQEKLEARFRAVAAEPEHASLFIFELSDEGYEFLSNGRIRYHAPSEGPTTWLCCLHRRSDCYRVERSSSRAGLSPAVVQRLFTAHCKRLFASV